MPHNRKGCLAGCISDYRGDGPDGFGVEPLGGTFGQVVSMAPYIEARIEGSGVQVTVGNSSFNAAGEGKNTAVVKSLEYGCINKMEGKIEIVDEIGGDLGFLNTSLNKMEKCIPNLGTGHRLIFRVGWVGIDCNGNKFQKLSPRMRSIINIISSQVSNGLIKFTMNFGPVEAALQIYRPDVTFGTDEDPITITDALKQLGNYTEGGSPKLEIKYAQQDADGKIEIVDSFNWRNYGKKGPEAKWPCNLQNKYETIAKWIAPYRVQDGADDRGLVLIHGTENPSEVVLLLDPSPIEEERKNLKSVICNYVVNGGSCSNVLEFNPKLDIISVMRKTRSGGSSGGALTSNGEFVEDDNNPTPERKGADAGPQTQVIPTQAVVYSAGTSNAQKEMKKSQEAHLRAEGLVTAFGGIEAELRIVGSTLPEYHSLNFAARFVSITIINPFSIRGGGDKSCGDFLQKADCNQFLSNKGWLVLGWSHSIQEGSFVTTLKVQLAAPGVDITTSADNKLGANDTGIEIDNTC